MESIRGLDTIWTIKLLAEAKRLVTMAMWQTGVTPEEIDLMVKAMDAAAFEIRPKKPNKPPVQRLIKRAFRYDIAALGHPIANHVRPFLNKLHWHQNANYNDPELLDSYAFTEFIGPMGNAVSKDIRFGVLLMASGTHYKRHHHPAPEIYFVLSGQARFRKDGKPWRTCTSGMFQFHDSMQPHEIETRDDQALLLYWWRGDVETMAVMSEEIPMESEN